MVYTAETPPLKAMAGVLFLAIYFILEAISNPPQTDLRWLQYTVVKPESQ